MAGVRATRPVRGQHLIASSGTATAGEYPEAGVHDVLEEQRVEFAQGARGIGRLGEHGHGDPHTIGEPAVVARLLNKARGELELDLDGHELNDLL